MKMGTPSLWRYDTAACRALQSAKLRYPTTLHYPLRVLPSILEGSGYPATMALAINPGVDAMGSQCQSSETSRNLSMHNSAKARTVADIIRERG